MKNNSHYKKDYVGTAYYAVPTLGRINAGNRHACSLWRAHAGQVTMEYAVIFAVMLAAIFATGIIDRSRNSFGAYLTKANDAMTVIKSADASAGGALGSDAAAAADAANNAREELARLKDESAEKKEIYEEKRRQNLLTLIFMPKFEKTTEGRMLASKIGAYERVVAELSAK